MWLVTTSRWLKSLIELDAIAALRGARLVVERGARSRSPVTATCVELHAVAPELDERAGAADRRDGRASTVATPSTSSPISARAELQLDRTDRRDRAAGRSCGRWRSRLDDRGLAQLVGEHERGRAADRRVGDAGAGAGAVIVAAADRGDAVALVRAGRPTARSTRGTNACSTDLPLAGDELDRRRPCSHGVSSACSHGQPMQLSPRSSAGWLTMNTRALRGDVVEHCRDRAAAVADPVIDVRVSADRVAVARVRRDLGAAQEQHVRMHRLRGGDSACCESVL